MASPKSILTITSPAASYDLTSLITLKSELNITGTGQDNQLREAIHRASENIQDYCRRTFAAEGINETFKNWCGNEILQLKRTPIKSISSITVDGTVVDESLYEFDPDNQIKGYVFPLDASGNRELYPSAWVGFSSLSYGSIVSIDYIGGYTLLDELPYAVEEACINLIKHKRATGGGSSSSNVSKIEVPGVWSKTFDTSSKESNLLIPSAIQDLLNPYRKPLGY